MGEFYFGNLYDKIRCNAEVFLENWLWTLQFSKRTQIYARFRISKEEFA